MLVVHMCHHEPVELLEYEPEEAEEPREDDLEDGQAVEWAAPP